MRLPLALCALLAAVPARAEPVEGPAPDPAADQIAERPLTAEEFDALTRGTTLDTYDSTFGLYGWETYLPGQRVIWKDADGCMTGTWSQVGDQICFVYENDPADPVCWAYFDRGDHIAGWLDGDPGLMSIELIDKGTAPLSCGEYLGA
jgi:hypothetical protein